MDDLDDLLTWSEAFGNLYANGTFTDAGNESLDYPVMNIRFQQRQSNLAHCAVNIGLIQLSAFTQVFENAVKPAAQALKHGHGGLRLASGFLRK
jgi:hypothetical protein